MTSLPDYITALLLAAFVLCSGTKADCPQGQYRASPGLCCLLCDAGTFKIEDCSTEGGYAHCLSCSDGKYTDGDNQEPWCLTCTVCGQNEVIQRDCKATQNRKCVCDAGFYRPKNGDPCQEKSLFQASDGANLLIAISGAVGGVCLLVAALICYFLMRKYWRRGATN
ncbi:tumor necrosis factor receptor superfamily member 23-like [Lampetra fluviatilis]